MTAFEFYTAGRIIFAAGALDKLPELAPGLGQRALLVVGGQSAHQSGLSERVDQLIPSGEVALCGREPHIDDVDRAVAAAKRGHCDYVVAVGGGSVIDCGKAAAAMMTNDGSLADYLEGVGKGKLVSRRAAPMIAVPTTAGTGSEVTKNAVITGPGYKKSIRSPLMIPTIALVDPLLTHTMPAAVTAASGMDALTQVIEPYLSRGHSPMTDGLCRQGIRAATAGLVTAFEKPADAEAREQMALASLLGGVVLANGGLGAVHGLAASLGAHRAIPHGTACARLLAPVMAANLEATKQTEAEDHHWSRFAGIAGDLTGQSFSDRDQAVTRGLTVLDELTERLAIPRLAELGVTREDFDAIIGDARGSSMRYNPVELSDGPLRQILDSAL